jgi:S-(hydroxymethyl)glutathione dehydrogenase/alcohol dehydrogenase
LDKRYINRLYGQCRPFVDFSVLLSLYAQKGQSLDEMAARTYPLSGLAKTFEQMKPGMNERGVLIPLFSSL